MAEQKQYHRLESPTHTKETALLQEQSQELWGKPARGSGLLSVKAYRGPLPKIARGIDAATDLAPHKGSGSPNDARWYFPDTPGTFLRKKNGIDFAAIKAKVTNRQP
jgi:hypothetical protein